MLFGGTGVFANFLMSMFDHHHHPFFFFNILYMCHENNAFTSFFLLLSSLSIFFLVSFIVPFIVEKTILFSNIETAKPQLNRIFLVEIFDMVTGLWYNDYTHLQIQLPYSSNIQKESFGCVNVTITTTKKCCKCHLRCLKRLLIN